MAELRLTRARDVNEFERLALPYLGAREAEHNLLFGILAGIRSGAYSEAPYLAVVHADGRAVATAVRTPPWNLVLSTMDETDALRLLADDAVRLWPDLPGVLGPKELAAAFAAWWLERTGHPATLWTEERVFRLTRVRPPRPVPGRVRTAETADRALVVAWLVDFAAEALRQRMDPSDAGVSADRSIASGTMYLWDDGGAVSMTGARPVTPNGSRIGPVYTPGALRGRGYASALVAAVSQLQFDRARRYCFLFTDLANPTSNKIYREIGYEPVCDVDEYRFRAPDQAPVESASLQVPALGAATARYFIRCLLDPRRPSSVRTAARSRRNGSAAAPPATAGTPWSRSASWRRPRGAASHARRGRPSR